MLFWRNKKQETPEQIQARQDELERSWQNLMQGELPALAQERLQRLASASPPLFTSGATPGGLLMMKSCGCRPLGQVQGVSSYCINWKAPEKHISGRMGTTADIFWTARMLAISRMQEQAHRLQASHVVGARISRVKQVGEPSATYGWIADYTYWASGTAVRFDNEPLPAKPYVCTMSAPRIGSLRQAGFEPVGYVLGNSVRHQIVETEWGTEDMQQNLELSEYTQGVGKSTAEAMKQLEKECVNAGATGLLSAKVGRELYPCGVATLKNLGQPDLIISISISGTAIAERCAGQIPPIDYAQVMIG